MSSFEAALTAYLRQQQDAQTLHPAEYWHPSMFGRCDREAILKREGIEATPFTDETLKKFWLGNNIHETLQKMAPFEVLGAEKTATIRDDDWHISGRTDGLVLNEGVVEVLEFKSIKDSKWAPKDEHILQTGAYLSFTIMCMHPLEDGKPICSHEDRSVPHIYPQPSRGRLIYWDKKTERTVEFIVERNKLLTQRVLETLERLETAYQRYKQTGELPQGDERFCNYRGSGRCCQDSPGDGGGLQVQALRPEVGSPKTRAPRRKRVATGESIGTSQTSMPSAEKLPF